LNAQDVAADKRKFLRSGPGRSVHDRLARSGADSQPRHCVGDFADRGEVLEAAAADVATELLAGRDPDADL